MDHWEKVSLSAVDSPSRAIRLHSSMRVLAEGDVWDAHSRVLDQAAKIEWTLPLGFDGATCGSTRDRAAAPRDFLAFRPMSPARGAAWHKSA